MKKRKAITFWTISGGSQSDIHNESEGKVNEE